MTLTIDDYKHMLDDALGQLRGAAQRTTVIEEMASLYGHEEFAREILKMRAGLPNIFGIQDVDLSAQDKVKH